MHIEVNQIPAEAIERACTVLRRSARDYAEKHREAFEEWRKKRKDEQPVLPVPRT